MIPDGETEATTNAHLNREEISLGNLLSIVTDTPENKEVVITEKQVPPGEPKMMPFHQEKAMSSFESLWLAIKQSIVCEIRTTKAGYRIKGDLLQKMYDVVSRNLQPGNARNNVLSHQAVWFINELDNTLIPWTLLTIHTLVKLKVIQEKLIEQLLQFKEESSLEADILIQTQKALAFPTMLAHYQGWKVGVVDMNIEEDKEEGEVYEKLTLSRVRNAIEILEQLWEENVDVEKELSDLEDKTRKMESDIGTEALYKKMQTQIIREVYKNLGEKIRARVGKVEPRGKLQEPVIEGKKEGNVTIGKHDEL